MHYFPRTWRHGSVDAVPRLELFAAERNGYDRARKVKPENEQEAKGKINSSMDPYSCGTLPCCGYFLHLVLFSHTDRL